MNDILADIFNDKDKMLIAVLLLALWNEQNEQELTLALLYILLV